MTRRILILPLSMLLLNGAYAQAAVEEERSFELGSDIKRNAFVSAFEVVGDRALSFRLDQMAVADEPSSAVHDSVEKDGTGWEFQISPYVWMAGVKADTAVGPAEASGEADFIDLLKKLDVGAMLHFEGRKERWGFMLDGLYMSLSDDVKVRVANVKIRGIDIHGELEMTLIEAGLFYRFGAPNRHFDAMAGVRYWRIDTEVDAGPLPSFSADKDWIDPFVGGRFQLDLSDKWLLALRGDIGGFDVGSELSWNVTGSFGYRLSEKTTLAFGYRHLDIDYDSGNFSFDAEMSGPYFGVSLGI